MALTLTPNFPLSVKDVVSQEIIPFSRKVITILPVQDIIPGDVIDGSTGELVNSSSASAFVALEYKKAQGSPVALLVGGSNLWYKKFNLRAVDIDKAVELLSTDPTVRFSDANNIDGLPTT